MDRDAPQPDARHAFRRQTDSADALAAFEHRIVAEADCSELQHGFSRAVLETHNAALAEYIGRAALGKTLGPKIPAPETLGPAPVPACDGSHKVNRADPGEHAAVFSVQHLFCFVRGNTVWTRTPTRSVQAL